MIKINEVVINHGLKAASVSSNEFFEFKKLGAILSFLSECLKCLTPEHTIQHKEIKMPKAIIPIAILVM